MYIFLYLLPSPSSGNPDIAMHQLYKELDLEPPKLYLNQRTTNIAADIAPHISSAWRDLGVIVEKKLFSCSTKFVDAVPEGTLDLCSWAENEQKNTQNNVIEGENRTPPK